MYILVETDMQEARVRRSAHGSSSQINWIAGGTARPLTKRFAVVSPHPVPLSRFPVDVLDNDGMAIFPLDHLSSLLHSTKQFIGLDIL